MPSFNYVSGNPSNLTAGGAANMADIQGPFTDLRSAINGNLDETNVPNLAAAFTTYRTVALGGGNATSGAVTGAGTYGLYVGSTAAASSAVWGTGFAAYAFYLDSTDWTANARTTKLRLRVTAVCNAVASGTTSTVGLYPVSAFGGGSGAQPTIATLGTVIVGSTVQFVTPGASSVTVQTSGDFNAPSAGHYTLMINTASGYAANSQITFLVHLQMRQV